MVFLLVWPHRLCRYERKWRPAHFPAAARWRGAPQAAPWSKENIMKRKGFRDLILNRSSSHRVYPRAIAGDRAWAAGETWFCEMA